MQKQFLMTALLLAAMYPLCAEEGLFLIRNREGSVIIDRSGRIVFDATHGFIWAGFSEGLAPVVRNGRWGFINRTGSVVIQPQFRSARQFSEGLAAVETDSGWGFIDKQGTFIIPPRRNDLFFFHQGRALTQGHLCGATSTDPKQEVQRCAVGPYGFIDRDGKPIVPMTYARCLGFREGFAPCAKGRQFGFLGLNGNVSIPFSFDYADSFYDGLAVVGRKGRYGFIDTTGGIAIPLRYSRADHFSDGVAPVLDENPRKYWSYIDSKGTTAIRTRATAAQPFSEGLAAVLIDGKFGFIDKRGNLAIPPRFHSVHSFSDGLALVVVHDSHYQYLDAYTDKSGKIIYRSNATRSLP